MTKNNSKVTKGAVGASEKQLRATAKLLGWDLNSAMFKAELQAARRIDNPDTDREEVETSSPQDNLKIKRDGDLAIITIDLTKTYGKSKSGKSEMVASTLGSVNIGDVSFNINAWK